MSLLVYVSQECKKEAKIHAVTTEVERFRKRLLTEQRTSLFDHFPFPYMKKRLKRQIRLIAQQYPLGEHLVVCFLRVLVRGKSEYDRDFLNDPAGYGKRHLSPLIDEQKLVLWLNQALKEAPPPQPREPDENERRYLWDVLGVQSVAGTEVFVCESEDWVKAINQHQAIQGKLKHFIDPIFDSSENGTDKSRIISLPNQPDWTIIGRYLARYRKLFLAGMLTSGDQGEERRIREKYSAILSADPAEITEQQVLQLSMRAYPNELLLYEDLWCKVQKDEASNLALSPEETTILESVHNLMKNHQRTSTGFPLFINGRAGCGKSTILQYLFTDYFRFSFDVPEHSKLSPPVYFTCSSDLLRRSRNMVSSLIECGHRYALKDNEQAQSIDPRRVQKALETCFLDFRQFLYSKLARKDQRDSFPVDKRISYAQFIRLWQDKFGHEPRARKHYGAEVSWHVIRSYIKGLSTDDYLDPDEYAVQPDREKTVSLDTYTEVYEKVWKNWYKRKFEKKEGWDDQDLARKLLDGNKILPTFPAVFCDEAQDFTRLDLEILFRLSIFSERRLTSHEIGRVPFAFAGDPFQTLNPTGFQWEAIKSAYVLKFLRALDPVSQSQDIDLNYQELSYNYRSSKNVVKLCNSIQALRSVLFKLPKMIPQTSWKHENTSPVLTYFEQGDPGVLDALKKETSMTIILPCQEGEEITYVENDQFLSSFVPRDETGVPQNVLSAIRAKGLEFNRVVLYGFGEDCLPELLQPLLGEGNSGKKTGNVLSMEYFLNRLYVAASRARRRLFVVDTPRGLKTLWRFATDLEVQEALVNQLPAHQELWRENIGGLQRGEANGWSSDRDDVAEIAHNYEREGTANQDPYLLRSAAMAYRNAGDRKKEKQCRALALWYEFEYKKAGDTYRDSEDYSQALLAYWEGSEYQAILSLGEIDPGQCSRIEHRVSEYLVNTGTPQAGMELLRHIEQHVLDPAVQKRIASSAAWKKAINDLMKRLIKSEGSDAPAQSWLHISQSLERLSAAGFTFSSTSMGTLFYRAEDWTRTLSCWKSSKDKKTPEYTIAAARALISIMERGGQPKLSQEGIQLLAAYYTQQGECAQALDYWASLEDESGLASICACTLDQDDRDSVLRVIELLLELFEKKGAWTQMVALARSGNWKMIHGDHQTALTSIVQSEADRILAKTTLLLARSENLIQMDSYQKKLVADFLKQYFIDDSITWKHHTTPEVAGAAIERAGRLVDSLQFYQYVMHLPIYTEEQKKRAQARWIKCKYRLIERDRMKKNRPSRRQLEQVLEKIEKWDIDVESLPDYPELNGLTEPVVEAGIPAVHSPKKSPYQPDKSLEPFIRPTKGKKKTARNSESEPIVLTVGDLTFHYSRTTGRVNIEHQVTLETAAVRLDTHQLTSPDLKFHQDPGNPLIQISPEWHIQFDLSAGPEFGILTVRFIKTGLMIRFPSAET